MDSSILIIGAGAAGLSAASKLLRDGFKNVKVYEARDRLGGRIFTRRQTIDSPPIEFGAQWIHGQIGNPVYKLCKEEGMVSHEEDPLYSKFYSWQQLSESQNELAKEVVTYCRAAVDECCDLSPEEFRTSELAGISLFGYLRAKIEVDWISKEDDTDKKQLIEAVFDWFIRLQNEVNGGEAKNVSAQYFGEYKECEGDPVVALGPEGYFGFLSVLLRDIPPQTISSGVEVKKIDYSASPVKVVTSLGEEAFDFVVCTFPLGVLKERQLGMFAPRLPDDKIRAIDALGFGICNKIYLVFDTKDVFWQRGDCLQILWKDGVNLSKKSWVHCLSRFNAVDRHPNLLVAWAAGESSKTMENDSDEEVQRKCHEVLSMVLGKDAPRPVAIRRSSWWSDPFSRGSYSYISTACDKGEGVALLPSTLALPLEVGGKPAVCFAGEATSEHFFSTVHGAFESGQREASRILKYIQERSIVSATCK